MGTLSLYNFPKRDDKDETTEGNNNLIGSSKTRAGRAWCAVASHDDINISLGIVIDRIRAMKVQERNKYYRCLNQYQHVNNHGRTKKYAVDEICRGKMCEWFYSVVDGCNMSRETVAVAMSYVDRLICCCSNEENGTEASLLSSSTAAATLRETILNSTSKFQLATMTCLYMAVKINDSVIMDIEVLVQLSKNAYSETDFKEMEMSILRALQWRLYSPTSMAFVRCYFALWLQLPSNDDIAFDYDLIEEMISDARYQTEIAVAESSFINCYPSQIALASVLNTIDTHITNSATQQKDILLSGLVQLNEESNRRQDEEIVTKIQENIKLLLAGLSPTNICGINNQATKTAIKEAEDNYDSESTADTDSETDTDTDTDSSTAAKKNIKKNHCSIDSEDSPVRVSTRKLI